MENPWLYKAPNYYPKNVKYIGPMSAEDRIIKLKYFDTSKLRAVINYPGTQKTVRAKAHMYLRRRGIDVDKSRS